MSVEVTKAWLNRFKKLEKSPLTSGNATDMLWCLDRFRDLDFVKSFCDVLKESIPKLAAAEAISSWSKGEKEIEKVTSDIVHAFKNFPKHLFVLKRTAKEKKQESLKMEADLRSSAWRSFKDSRPSEQKLQDAYCVYYGRPIRKAATVGPDYKDEVLGTIEFVRKGNLELKDLFDPLYIGSDRYKIVFVDGQLPAQWKLDVLKKQGIFYEVIDMTRVIAQ